MDNYEKMKGFLEEHHLGIEFSSHYTDPWYLLFLDGSKFMLGPHFTFEDIINITYMYEKQYGDLEKSIFKYQIQEEKINFYSKRR